MKTRNFDGKKAGNLRFYFTKKNLEIQPLYLYKRIFNLFFSSKVWKSNLFYGGGPKKKCWKSRVLVLQSSLEIQPLLSLQEEIQPLLLFKKKSGNSTSSIGEDKKSWKSKDLFHQKMSGFPTSSWEGANFFSGIAH